MAHPITYTQQLAILITQYKSDFEASDKRAQEIFARALNLPAYSPESTDLSQKHEIRQLLQKEIVAFHELYSLTDIVTMYLEDLNLHLIERELELNQVAYNLLKSEGQIGVVDSIYNSFSAYHLNLEVKKAQKSGTPKSLAEGSSPSIPGANGLSHTQQLANLLAKYKVDLTSAEKRTQELISKSEKLLEQNPKLEAISQIRQTLHQEIPAYIDESTFIADLTQLSAELEDTYSAKQATLDQAAYYLLKSEGKTGIGDVIYATFGSHYLNIESTVMRIAVEKEHAQPSPTTEVESKQVEDPIAPKNEDDEFDMLDEIPAEEGFASADASLSQELRQAVFALEAEKDLIAEARASAVHKQASPVKKPDLPPRPKTATKGGLKGKKLTKINVQAKHQ
jgi:hypothetical protein